MMFQRRSRKFWLNTLLFFSLAAGLCVSYSPTLALDLDCPKDDLTGGESNEAFVPDGDCSKMETQFKKNCKDCETSITNFLNSGNVKCKQPISGKNCEKAGYGCKYSLDHCASSYQSGTQGVNIIESCTEGHKICGQSAQKAANTMLF